MAKIIISPLARQDLREIGDYIAFRLHNKSAARNTVARIRQTILRLEDFPECGAPLRQSVLSISYRYLICGNYIVFYHLEESNALIDRVLYGKRDYLNLLFGKELDETE